MSHGVLQVAQSAGKPAARPRRRSRVGTSARYVRAPVPVANSTRRRAAAAASERRRASSRGGRGRAQLAGARAEGHRALERVIQGELERGI